MLRGGHTGLRNINRRLRRPVTAARASPRAVGLLRMRREQQDTPSRTRPGRSPAYPAWSADRHPPCPQFGTRPAPRRRSRRSSRWFASADYPELDDHGRVILGINTPCPASVSSMSRLACPRRQCSRSKLSSGSTSIPGCGCRVRGRLWRRRDVCPPSSTKSRTVCRPSKWEAPSLPEPPGNHRIRSSRHPCEYRSDRCVDSTSNRLKLDRTGLPAPAVVDGDGRTLIRWVHHRIHRRVHFGRHAEFDQAGGDQGAMLRHATTLSFGVVSKMWDSTFNVPHRPHADFERPVGARTLDSDPRCRH